MSVPSANIPQRRSLLLFALLAIFMVVFSYIFTLSLALACVVLPWLAISHVANFNTLALFVGGIVVAGIMLWSLIPRRDKFEAPGPLLESASHPRLFAEIENIAHSLGEPVPREVYLIGDPNAWVADRGGLMGIGSRRVMGLGLPLLAALSVSQFRAVLVHEFAHYYGGDTSLGPWLRRTQMAMVRTFRGIGSVGEHNLPAAVALLCVVVFGIMKQYWLIFLRAINFVSRRQEYRADELACILAGSQSLISGLSILHGTSLAWPPYFETEVAPTLDLGYSPPIAAGFSEFLAVPEIAKQVQSGIEAEIRKGKTDPYDSHPTLRDRIAAAESLTIQSGAYDSRPAYSLLDNLTTEEIRLVETANPDLQKNSLQPVSWEEQGGKVLIPSWIEWVTEYASLLQGITAEKLPEALGRLPEIGARIRDPKGMLLTPEQRVERARTLLGSAFALSLVTHGWMLHSRPGEFYFSRGDERLNPFVIVHQLSDGEITKDAWVARCRELGVGEVSLVGAAKAADAGG